MKITTPVVSALPPLPEELAGLAKNFLERLSEVAGRLPDNDASASLIRKCSERGELPSVWAASEFVANTCIGNPLILEDLISSGDLDQRYSSGEMGFRVESALEAVQDEADLHARLRRLRKRELVTIAWRDLSGMADLEETMADVSGFATASIASALGEHHRWLAKRFGEPRDPENRLCSMVVLAMGKLGGGELNFSSDVDLVFAYDRQGQTRPDADGQDGLDNQEFFTRLGQKVIAAIGKADKDGFVFRVDMRLRPNGESGPLVLSFAAMEHYYQTHGRDWERYAMVKARVIAGPPESGEQLLSVLRPFVFRKYLDFGAFDAIREMKGMIARELQQKDRGQDVKLGMGGIREVEFLIQSHQLIRGGRDRSLQTPELYAAMAALVQIGVLEDKERDQLLCGYRFLRATEHRLQMVSDQQTQQLPKKPLERLRIAWSMGFDDWESFRLELDRHRTEIHDQFRMILGADEVESSDRPGVRNPLSDLWDGNLQDPDLVSLLLESGFSSADSTPRLLRSFREGRLYQAFSNVERDRLDRLVPLALEQAANLPESERAISAFVSVVEAIGRRSVYLSLLIENPLALKQLLHLCAASPWISRHIGHNPVVLDELLNPLDDIREISRESLLDELRVRLDQVDEGDEEVRMNTLREFQNAQVLQVAAADVTGVVEVSDVHKALTLLAEVLVETCFDEAVEFARRRIGEPDSRAGVIAYGKFASIELGYHSDLDIVVCYDLPRGATPVLRNETEHFYSRAGRRLIHLLTSRTQAGYLYQIDMRLRPSGKSGTLVTSLEGFREYQENSAWTWEHQALVRARLVTGGEVLANRFEAVRESILTAERDQQQLREEVSTMRRRMIENNCQSTGQQFDLKLDEGGMVDIEFLVQFLVLANAHGSPGLIMPRTTPGIISALVKIGAIDTTTGTTLTATYETYLRHSLDLKLMDRPVLVGQDELIEERAAIKSIWTLEFG